MKTLSIKMLAIVLLMVAYSCKKDDDGMRRIAPPNKANFQNLRSAALERITQKTTFNVEDGLNFTSAKGAKLSIYSNCMMDEDNNLVTGEATVTYIEMYDIGNMVATNKPLMGKDDQGNLLPLVTGGQFYIDIKQGNKKLRTGCGFSLAVPAGLTGGIDQDMILWNGVIDENGNLAWEEADEKQETGVRPNEDQSIYNVWGQQFGWTNVDRFYNHTGPKTQIKVSVPSSYNAENAAVYLAYDDQPGLLAFLDTYNSSERFFSEHYGFVPIGLNVHVIFVSESNGSAVYAIKKITVAANATINISEADLNTGTTENLITLINNLH